MSLNLFKALLPRSRAWSLIRDRSIRRFFEGISVVTTDTRAYFDQVYAELFPSTTTRLSDWERQFGLLDYALSEEQRRTRIDNQWKFTGGQSPGYIQDTLRAAGFDVYVHEWWEPGTNPPVARNPNTYLRGSATEQFIMRDNVVDAQDGDAIAQDGGTIDLPGYPLVNKLTMVKTVGIGDGSTNMQDGDDDAQDGDLTISFMQRTYVVPTDADTFPYFLYIGGQTFPDTATVIESRREEFEDLCLKICPLEQWLGILVRYG